LKAGLLYSLLAVIIVTSEPVSEMVPGFSVYKMSLASWLRSEWKFLCVIITIALADSSASKLAQCNRGFIKNQKKKRKSSYFPSFVEKTASGIVTRITVRYLIDRFGKREPPLLSHSETVLEHVRDIYYICVCVCVYICSRISSCYTRMHILVFGGSANHAIYITIRRVCAI